LAKKASQYALKIAIDVATAAVGKPYMKFTKFVNKELKDLIKDKMSEVLEGYEVFGIEELKPLASKAQIEKSGDNHKEAYAKAMIVYRKSDNTFFVFLQSKIGNKVGELGGNRDDLFCDKMVESVQVFTGKVSWTYSTFLWITSREMTVSLESGED